MIVIMAVAAFIFPPATAMANRDRYPVPVVWIVTALLEFAAFGFTRLTLPCGTAVLALILGLCAIPPKQAWARHPSRRDRKAMDREVRKFRRELEAFTGTDPAHAAKYDPKRGDRKVAGRKPRRRVPLRQSLARSRHRSRLNLARGRSPRLSQPPPERAGNTKPKE